MIHTQFQCEHLIQTMFICSSASLQLEIIDFRIIFGAFGGNAELLVLMAFIWDKPQVDAPNTDVEHLYRRRNHS